MRCERASGPSVPPVSNWRTTDQDEVSRRQLRAAREPMRFENLTPEHPVFSNFRVDSASGQTYRIELRELRPLAASCACVDFQVNGLGTCKHVEGLLRWLRAASPEAFRRAESEGSARPDLVPDAATGRLCVERNLNLLPGALRALFDTTGVAQPDVPREEVLAAFGRAGRVAARVSQEVDAWLERLARNDERVMLRRAYEQSVREGAAPAAETKLPLLPYQREGMLHLAFAERALLADEMGLGKTAQAIAAAALLRRLGKVSRVLVVAPASLKAEWEEQIQLFTELPHRAVLGGRAARRAAYERAPFFTLVNYEQLLRDADLVGSVLRPDCLILDEAQRIKNWGTQTAQAVRKVQSRFAFVLTGTPLENRIDELYSLMSIVEPHALGPLFRFNREYYVLNESGRPTGYKNLQQLRERVKPYLLRRRKADVEKELPDRTDRVVSVALSPEQRALYAEREARVARLLSLSRERALARHEGERLQRELSAMRMLCDSPYILDEQCRVSPKVEELGALLEDALSATDVKVLVFSEWERMLRLVGALCDRQGFGCAWHTGRTPQGQRRQEILRFKSDPSCRVFLSTDTGGLGLNLQCASVVINCDLPWSPARLEQRVARAWRKNQLRSVTVINLVAEDTVESRMLATLTRKRELAEGVLDGAGGLDAQSFGAGRQGFLRRLEEVVSPARAAPPAQPSLEALRAVDPELGAAAALLRRLGCRLQACELRSDAQGRPTLLVAADVDAGRASEIARQVCAEWLGGDGRAPAVELVTPDAFAAVRRLVARGLLAEPAGEVRTLYAAGRGLDAPRLACDGRGSQAAELRRQAAQAFRAARQAVAGLAFERARGLLEDAALLLARAYAAQRSQPEPRDLREALSAPFRGLWGDAWIAVGDLCASDCSVVAVARALGTKFSV